MRRRTFMAGTTALAGLTALGTSFLPRHPAVAEPVSTAPRVLAEHARASDGLVRPGSRFDVVTVSGGPRTRSADAAIRFETAEGLGGWQPLRFHTAGRDDRDPVSSAVVRAPADAVGYEVRGGAETAALNLSDGEELRVRGPERVVVSAGEYRTLPRGASLRIRTRAGWCADESLRFDEDGDDLWEAEFHPVQTLTVHHTALPAGDDHAADVRAIYHQHAVGQAWGDIGYHLLIDPDGVVYEGRHSGEDGVPVFSGRPRPGRSRSVTAGHVFGFNHGNVGVCLLGDFTDALPTPVAQDALVDVLRVLCSVTGLDPAARIEYVNPTTGAATPGDAISRHRDWLATECPGNTFAEVFDTAIRRRVAQGRS